MAASKKYSYKDWWDRKISFKNATLFSEGEIKEHNPLLVSWDEIKTEDKPKIKEKQKEIFNTEVNKTIKKWKTDFTKTYRISKAKPLLLKRELHRFEAIMYDPIHSTNNSTISFDGILIPITSLLEIKNYIENTKINGALPEYDLFHSHSFNTKNHIFPHIFAECCWLYVEWLKIYLKPKKTKKRQQSPPLSEIPAEESSVKNSNVDIVPDNPYPVYFKNGYAYNMFLELQILMVNQNTNVADYGSIFHKMRDSKLKAIHIHITQYTFIEFLRNELKVDINGKRLPYRDPIKNRKIFASILEKYKNNIISK